MKCAQARRLFGAYWDDETSQAEREWLESHFTGCAACRKEYEEFARALEWTGSLTRVDASPDFLQQTLSRARRVVSAPDRISAAGVQWVPVTAAVALLLLVATLVSPWMGLGPGPRMANRSEEPSPAAEREVLQPTRVGGDDTTVPAPPGTPSGVSTVADPLAVLSDSLFDHSEDIEFILDPVTLRRGRATVTRLPGDVKGERAVISF